MKFFALAALLLVSPPLLNEAAQTAEVQSKTYAVVWRVTADGSGGISDLKLDHVIDPSGPGTAEEVARRAVDIRVPDAYVAAVRTFLENLERSRPSKLQKVYYTYTIYDPAQPSRADIGVEKPS
jgi:hypothetical protein